jgi:hypothetical protein
MAVTKASPASSYKFSSTQQHLDEEAVSRMDDEGGAPDARAVNPPGEASESGLGS